MNYHSRKELLEKLCELSKASETAQEEAGRLIREMEDEWHAHSAPAITYHNIKKLSEQLIQVCMVGSGLEDRMTVFYAFLQEADQE